LVVTALTRYLAVNFVPPSSVVPLFLLGLAFTISSATRSTNPVKASVARSSTRLLSFDAPVLKTFEAWYWKVTTTHGPSSSSAARTERRAVDGCNNRADRPVNTARSCRCAASRLRHALPP
jgi:hypothetical protein